MTVLIFGYTGSIYSCLLRIFRYLILSVMYGLYKLDTDSDTHIFQLQRHNLPQRDSGSPSHLYRTYRLTEVTLQLRWPRYYRENGRFHMLHCPVCIILSPPFLLSSNLFKAGCYWFNLLNYFTLLSALNHIYLTWLIYLNYYGKHFANLKI